MVEVFALCGGYLELDRASMLADLEASQPWTVPVGCYLVVHPRGRLLFDTGVHCSTMTDPVGRMGAERAKRIGVKSRPGDDVVSQLATMGLEPEDVTHVANSHLHFDHALDYQMIDGEHDVFGDGTVVLIPTYGHTPGHQSMVVRAGKGTTLVCASDACYTRENMDRDVLPQVLWDASVMRDSLASLRALRDRQGATMFYGHDPEQWAAAPRAPAAVV